MIIEYFLCVLDNEIYTGAEPTTPTPIHENGRRQGIVIFSYVDPCFGSQVQPYFQPKTNKSKVFARKLAQVENKDEVTKQNLTEKISQNPPQFQENPRNIPEKIPTKKEIPGVANHVKNLTTPFAPDHNTPKEHTGGYGSFADKNRPEFIHKQEQAV